MKNFISLLVAIAIAILPVSAVTLSTNVTGPTTNNILAGSIRVNQITVANNTAAALTLLLIDAPSTGFTYTNASYSSLSISGPTNLVTTYTNFFGVVESWTNKVIGYATNTVAASTNNYPYVLNLVVPANTTQIFTPDGVVQFMRGVLVTNSTNANITLDYLRLTP